MPSGTAVPLRVGVLAYPGCFASELYGVPDLLTIATGVAAATGRAGTGYDVCVISARRRVEASGNVPVAVRPLREVDLLIVPGFELFPEPDAAGVLAGLGPEVAAIRAHFDAGTPLVAICVGAFLAAEAGVLDGRRATTSWLFADQLARRYPAVDVHADQLTITDGGVTTTGAFSAMYDFALNLIRHGNGAEVARRTARIALVDDARDTQSPYVDARLLPAPGSAFSAAVMRRLDQHLREPYHLPGLAARFRVSSRTLLRRFRAETGQTPLQYLQAARVRRARHLLESTELTVSAVAAAVGYQDAGTLSALFARQVGQRPAEYRAAFRPRAASFRS
jgi:transcriptional regulator GlxA family with amidase domain